MCGVAPGQLCTFDGDGQTLPHTHCYQATSDTISRGHFIRASRDSGRPSVRRSAPPLYCAMREGMLELTVAVHRWRFTSSIPPAHKEGGAASSPVLVLQLVGGFALACDDLASFSRNVWFRCAVHPGYRLMQMTVCYEVIALCDVGPWDKHSPLPHGRFVRNGAVTVTRCAPGAAEEAVGRPRDKTQS